MNVSYQAKRRGLKRHALLSKMTPEEVKAWYDEEAEKLIAQSGHKTLQRRAYKAKLDADLKAIKAPEARRSYIINRLIELNRELKKQLNKLLR